jgi:hypothetical protein
MPIRLRRPTMMATDPPSDHASSGSVGRFDLLIRKSNLGTGLKERIPTFGRAALVDLRPAMTCASVRISRQSSACWPTPERNARTLLSGMTPSFAEIAALPIAGAKHRKMDNELRKQTDQGF